MAMASNLRDKEISILNKMLTLSSSNGSSTDFNDQWKVLVYDSDGRDIISPLLNIGALRARGVTLHMLINANREAVPDAPAVYFIRPTETNIRRIVEDCSKKLYRAIYLHFITRIDRPLLELLVQLLVAVNGVSMIAKIFDQYLDMIALEPNLFTLNIQNSFMLYNEPSLSESQIRSFMNRVATGLLSTIRVLGSLPIIRCAPGGAAEMLSQELNSILKENISAKGPAQALLEDCLVNDRSRPLLLITDRVTDLFPILQHSSTYQALISDLLDLKLNRVNINDASPTSSKDAPAAADKGRGDLQQRKKTYDLNTATDTFLRSYAGSPFPEAIDANERELAEVAQREAALRARPVETAGASSGVPGLSADGHDLSEAIESLPEILQKKANLEAHTNILQAVMKRIAAREIPTYFELEQGILSLGGRVADRSAIMGLLRDGSKGSAEDKLRLLLLMAVTGDASMMSKAVVDELDAAFKQGCEGMSTNAPSNIEVDEALCAVQFMRRLQSLQSNSFNRPRGIGGSTAAASSTALLSSLLTTANTYSSTLMAKATSFFTKFSPYYVTRLVDNLAEGRACPEDESFCYFDPRSRNTDNSIVTGHKYSDVIVFVLGGGNYSEFFNLHELLKDKITNGNSSLRNVTYGSTDMISGKDFIQQLGKLSKPSAATK